MIIKSFDGTEIYYKIERKSRPFLVFLHGWAGNWKNWKKEIDFFRKKGFSVLTLDLRGHGKSDKPEEKEKYGFESFAKDLNEIVKKENIDDFVLIGHSMGGMISLVYYKMFPEKVNALVLCDTTYKNVLEHKKIRVLWPFVKHVLDFILKNTKVNKENFSHLDDLDLTNYKNKLDYFLFYKGLYNTPLKSVFACLETMVNYDVKDILEKINIPVLIIEGSKDTIMPELESREMYKKIKGSEINFIPNGKHCVNIQNPDEVDNLILKFLDKYI